MSTSHAAENSCPSAHSDSAELSLEQLEIELRRSIEKKIVYKWTHAIQTCVVHWSTVIQIIIPCASPPPTTPPPVTPGH